MSKIEMETFYPHKREHVWDALTDSNAIKQWLMDNDFKPVVGHRFQFRAKPQPKWRGIVDGEVLAVEKPSRLVYTWKGEEKYKPTTITWSLEEVPNGTKLTLYHTGFEGIGGFILSKLILGPGWKKLMRKLLPIVVAHIKSSGLDFPKGRWLIPEKEKHSAEGPPR